MKMLLKKTKMLIAVGALISWEAKADIVAVKVGVDLSKVPVAASVFANASETLVTLMAQPMVVPRPKTTTTDKVFVKAVHDGKWIAFSLRWADTEMSEAGPLGKFSDACAIQFPVKSNDEPPPITMGAKDNPVHIFHWRLQYQIDKTKGVRDIKDIYPNMNVDIYPMEFPDMGNIEKFDAGKREVYSYGKAAGNPQSYVKKGVDEIVAEGYGTSSVMESVEAEADGVWAKGEWTTVITRPLKSRDGSALEVGKGSFASFAIWQGGQDEVGSRKSVTLVWTPIIVAK